MHAPVKPLSRRAHAALNRKFEKKMLRRIRLMALRACSDKDCELRYELVAEVVARAYAAFVRLGPPIMVGGRNEALLPAGGDTAQGTTTKIVRIRVPPMFTSANTGTGRPAA